MKQISYTRMNTILIILLIIISFFSLFIGTVNFSPLEVFAALLGQADRHTSIIVLELRLPRVFMGLLAGATLGLSGAALQGMLRNPLADPGIIGVTSTASLGAIIAIYFGLSTVFPGAIQLMAILGALVATLILAMIAARDSSVLTLILAGIAISSLATAAMSLAMNFAPNPMTLQDMIMWMLGSLENRTISDIYISLPFIIIGWALHFGIANGLDLTISTFKQNIPYYLGQTSMATGDYATVISAMDEAINVPVLFAYMEELIPVTYWKYMAHRKMGNHQLAEAELAKVPEEYQLIENDSYHAAVNYLKGNYERDDFLKSAGVIGKYAVAMKDHFDGHNEDAIKIWNGLTDAGPRGFWPAEAELMMVDAN